MRLSPDRIQRLTGYASLVVIVALPISLFYAWKLRLGTEYVETWLPGDSPSRLVYADFSRRFGETQPLLFSWRDAHLDDPRLSQATEFLLEQWSEHPNWPIHALFNSKQAIDRLQESLRGMSKEQVTRRLSGQAVGRDGASFIVLQLTDPTPLHRDQIIAACVQAATLVGVSPEDTVIAGESFQTHEIDRYSRISVQRYVPISMILCLGIAWFCLRSWQMTLMVMALAGMGQLLGMALISATVGQMGAILIVVPTLLFMLTLSAAVHLTHYFLDFFRSGQEFPAVHAIGVGAFPCVMAASTTAFGFVSLALSDLEPVFQFGLLAAGGMILCTLFLLLVFIPAGRLASCGMQPRLMDSTSSSFLIDRLFRFILRRSSWIVVAGLILFAICFSGLARLTATTRFDGMFPDAHPAVRSLRWVEENLGPIETLEFLVSFPMNPPATDILEQLAVVQRLESTMESHPQVHSTFSASCVLPQPPQQRGTRATVRRAVFRRLLSSELDQLAAAQLICNAESEVCWRITARFKTLSDSDFHRLQTELVKWVEDDLTRVTQNLDSRPTLQVTGLRTVIESANQILLRDLAGSFAMAFVLITPFMMLSVRSVMGGIILMLPNVLPVVFVFGIMGWLSIPMDVASILTASVALGIAVDDTLHCVVWYLRARDNGETPERSAEQAIKRCARPMLHTTLICSGAMIPFLFCEFLPTGKFALLLILILSSAIVSDLIFLPSLLCSPLGRWIGGPRKNSMTS